jgi:hypothetical protein
MIEILTVFKGFRTARPLAQTLAALPIIIKMGKWTLTTGISNTQWNSNSSMSRSLRFSNIKSLILAR